MFRLDDKIIVMFGGNGYLGRQFCKAILEYGGTLYSCDLDVEKSEDVSALKEKYKDKYSLMQVNASVKEELTDFCQLLIKKESQIDVLINSTTMKGDDFYLPFEDVSLEGWNTGLLGNLTIPFLTIQTFIPLMKKRKRGSIINIASHYGTVGNDQRIYEGSNLHEIYVKKSPNIKRIYSHGAFNAAKGGLINFTRYLAAYYGQDNIRVNAISPGGVYLEGENKTFLRKYGDKVPLGRKAKPDEINGAVIYLASDASSYVTGHNLVVDGGYTIW